ncbi:MAG: hypothetical protein KGJ79_07375 [Alphaproteobacteria bacterium]|nr:hypothetical protein [Alphaproteobacteria bacterium]
MFRILVAAVCVAAVAVQADAAPSSDWKEIARALDSIPTAANEPLNKRIERCKITVNKKSSWIELLTADNPNYGAKVGQTVLRLEIDVPGGKGDGGPAPKQPPEKNQAAVWVIDHGKATPLSTWATSLQNRPVPLGYDAWMNC